MSVCSVDLSQPAVNGSEEVVMTVDKAWKHFALRRYVTGIATDDSR
jgi:hypothetical protein